MFVVFECRKDLMRLFDLSINKGLTLKTFYKYAQIDAKRCLHVDNIPNCALLVNYYANNTKPSLTITKPCTECSLYHESKQPNMKRIRSLSTPTRLIQPPV